MANIKKYCASRYIGRPNDMIFYVRELLVTFGGPKVTEVIFCDQKVSKRNHILKSNLNVIASVAKQSRVLNHGIASCLAMTKIKNSPEMTENKGNNEPDPALKSGVSGRFQMEGVGSADVFFLTLPFIPWLKSQGYSGSNIIKTKQKTVPL